MTRDGKTRRLIVGISGATTVEQQVDQILGKALRFFGIDYAPFVTWQGSGRQDMMH